MDEKDKNTENKEEQLIEVDGMKLTYEEYYEYSDFIASTYKD